MDGRTDGRMQAGRQADRHTDGQRLFHFQVSWVYLKSTLKIIQFPVLTYGLSYNWHVIEYESFIM